MHMNLKNHRRHAYIQKVNIIQWTDFFLLYNGRRWNERSQATAAASYVRTRRCINVF